MDYQLSADKLKNDSYYDELNYQLALDKQKASAEKTEYDRLSDRADTLADYGIFDGYKQLGYTDSEFRQCVRRILRQTQRRCPMAEERPAQRKALRPKVQKPQKALKAQKRIKRRAYLTLSA